jgi:hypothetical protein
VRVKIAPIVAAGLVALLGGQTQAATIQFAPAGGGGLVVDQGGELLVNVLLSKEGAGSLLVRGFEFYLEVTPVGGAPDNGLLFGNLAAQPYTQTNYIFPDTGPGGSPTSQKEISGQPVAVTLTGATDPATGLPIPAGNADTRFFGGSDEHTGAGVLVGTNQRLIAQLRLKAGANTAPGSQYTLKFTKIGDNESELDADETGGTGNPFGVTALITVQGQEPPPNIIPAPPGLVLALIGVPFVGLVARRARKAAPAVAA